MLCRDANWSPEFRSNKDFVSLLKEKNLDMNDIHIAIDVYNYIDQQGEMGAKAITLVDRYEDKQFLQKILDFFNEDKLVMKTGVCEVTYVHWKHIKSWVVNTYNLKRINRVCKRNSNQFANNNSFALIINRSRFHHRRNIYCKWVKLPINRMPQLNPTE